MEKKKVLKDKELEKVTGGGADRYWVSDFYCEKCHRSYNIRGEIDTYKCPDCGTELRCSGQRLIDADGLSDRCDKGRTS